MAGIELIVGRNVGRHSRDRNSKRCRHVFDRSNYVEIIPEGKKKTK